MRPVIWKARLRDAHTHTHSTAHTPVGVLLGYLDVELQNLVPQDLTEAAAKVAIYEPIVESIMGTFEQNYIKCDTKSFNLLKESRKVIADTRAELTEKTEQLMSLNKKYGEVARQMKISKVCEGLTPKQYERAVKLLEGTDTSKIDSQFAVIRDLVISEEVSTPKVQQKEIVRESAQVAKTVSESSNVEETEKTVITESAISPETQRILGYKSEFSSRWGKR